MPGFWNRTEPTQSKKQFSLAPVQYTAVSQSSGVDRNSESVSLKSLKLMLKAFSALTLSGKQKSNIQALCENGLYLTLHEAITKDQNDVVLELIKQLQDSDQLNWIARVRDQNGNTPLMLATKMCKPVVAAAILGAVAHPRSLTLIQDDDGLKPAHVAGLLGQAEIMKSLKKHGARTDGVVQQGLYHGMTVLELAAPTGRIYDVLPNFKKQATEAAVSKLKEGGLVCDNVNELIKNCALAKKRVVVGRESIVNAERREELYKKIRGRANKRRWNICKSTYRHKRDALYLLADMIQGGKTFGIGCFADYHQQLPITFDDVMHSWGNYKFLNESCCAEVVHNHRFRLFPKKRKLETKTEKFLHQLKKEYGDLRMLDKEPLEEMTFGRPVI